MFRHYGSKRSYKQNLRLATMLSFVAGIVNITGILSIRILTTNVTGHFAYFSEEFFKKNYTVALVYLAFTLFFLLGAFTSNVLTEIVIQKSPRKSHLLPFILEIVLLLSVAFFGNTNTIDLLEIKFSAFALLFAMGIQNSMVTKISKSTVRTTHLTGLFTDLGIELSQLIFNKKPVERLVLKSTIYLRLSIIFFFFMGCFVGGLCYNILKFKTLIIATLVLLLALFYDYSKLKIIKLKRSLTQNKL